MYNYSMADIIETPEEEKEEESVEGKSFDDIIAEEPPKEPQEETKEEPEEESKEDPKEDDVPQEEEEKPVEPTTEPPEVEPEVPLVEIKDEIVKKTKEEVKEDILKAIGITEEEKQEAEDKGFKFAWEERGEEAPATWRENAEETTRFQTWQKEQQDIVLAEEEKKKLADTQERQTVINAEWDTQLDYLRSEGHLPEIDLKIKTKLKEGKVLSAQERQDTGLQAQVKLFESMFEVAQQREAEGLPPITDAVHIYSRYYKKDKQPTGTQGKKAPVSGGSTPISQKQEEETYEEIHKAEGFAELMTP